MEHVETSCQAKTRTLFIEFHPVVSFSKKSEFVDAGTSD